MCEVFWEIFFQIHPWNLTWNLKIIQLKRNIIFQTLHFSGSILLFQGGNQVFFKSLIYFFQIFPRVLTVTHRLRNKKKHSPPNPFLLTSPTPPFLLGSMAHHAIMGPPWPSSLPPDDPCALGAPNPSRRSMKPNHPCDRPAVVPRCGSLPPVAPPRSNGPSPSVKGKVTVVFVLEVGSSEQFGSFSLGFSWQLWVWWASVILR